MDGTWLLRNLWTFVIEGRLLSSTALRLPSSTQHVYVPHNTLLQAGNIVALTALVASNSDRQKEKRMKKGMGEKKIPQSFSCLPNTILLSEKKVQEGEREEKDNRNQIKGNIESVKILESHNCHQLFIHSNA